jgi:signal transduction histidine kinase
MKLLTRTTYYFLLYSLLAMIAAGFVFYFSIRSLVYNQIDESLITEKTIIQDQIEETDTIPDFAASFGHLIEVKLLDTPVPYSQTIGDTTLYDTKSKIYLPFRHIRVYGSTHRHTGYSINIYQILDENQALLDRIGIGMFLLFLTLLSLSLIVNYLISKKVFKPFFKAVSEAATFNVLSGKPVELSDTNIDEFRQLNKVIDQMTRKMRSDYINLKEYNENFSHEIQTPIAVIRSKLDVMMQNENLNMDAINTIRSINEATSRLLKLNQGLLFISRIENLQFEDSVELSFKERIENCLDNYEEILKLKDIRIELEISDPGMVKMNEILADVLISNLISNAVRYNFDGGFIKCHLDNRSLSITNSGNPLDTDPESLFERFSKNAGNTQSVGLGLSIVKKITDHFGMKISYTCTGNTHELKVQYRY